MYNFIDLSVLPFLLMSLAHALYIFFMCSISPF